MMIRGFFNLPDWITTTQRSGPRFSGVHVLESERSRGQCWRCRRMIGKRGESYVYVVRYRLGTEEWHACKRCHRKLHRRGMEGQDWRN